MTTTEAVVADFIKEEKELMPGMGGGMGGMAGLGGMYGWWNIEAGFRLARLVR